MLDGLSFAAFETLKAFLQRRADAAVARDVRSRPCLYAVRSDFRGDGVLRFNYRADRMREITDALVQDGFSGFDRGPGAPPAEL